MWWAIPARAVHAVQLDMRRHGSPPYLALLPVTMQVSPCAPAIRHGYPWIPGSPARGRDVLDHGASGARGYAHHRGYQACSRTVRPDMLARAFSRAANTLPRA